MSPTTTRAPAAANPSAIPLPTPLPPPITTALAPETFMRPSLLGGRSIPVAGVSEDGTTAEHRDRSVVADRDHRGAWVVVAVPPSGGVPSASDGLDGLLGVVARYESHAELAEHALGVEYGRAVDLCERVTQRRQV